MSFYTEVQLYKKPKKSEITDYYSLGFRSIRNRAPDTCALAVVWRVKLTDACALAIVWRVAHVTLAAVASSEVHTRAVVAKSDVQ